MEFKGLEVWGEPHIWAGDFNSVTREDTEWTELEQDREKLHTKNPEYDYEAKVDVAAKMVDVGSQTAG